MVSSGVTGTSQTNSSEKAGLNSTRKSNSSADFGTFMNNSVSASAKGGASFKDDIGKTNGNHNVKNESAAKKDSVDSQKNQKTDNVSNSSKKVNKKLKESDDAPLDSTADAKIKDALNDIREQIKKTFGITDEELTGFLQNLGISMQDLLYPANLTNLVVEMTGAQDVLTLLTNSDLSQQFKSLTSYVDSQVQNLSEQLNVSTKDLKQYIESLSIQDESTSDKSTEVVPGVTEEHQQKGAESLLADHDSKSEKVSGNSTLDKLQTVLESRMTVDTKLNAETGNSGGKDLMGNNQGENDNNSMLNNAAQNLAQKIDGVFSTMSTNNAQQIDAVDVIRQIVEAVKVKTTQEISSMEIQLNPEHLGKINLSVVAKDGMITAQLTVQDEAVRKSIENQLVILKENLNSQGIKIDAVEVTVASHQFEANQNFGNGGSEKDNQNKKSNSNIDSLADLFDEEMDEEIRHKNLINENSSVEYTA